MFAAVYALCGICSTITQGLRVSPELPVAIQKACLVAPCLMLLIVGSCDVFLRLLWCDSGSIYHPKPELSGCGAFGNICACIFSYTRCVVCVTSSNPV